MEVSIMNLEILLNVFSLIFCIFYLILFGITREMIKKEKVLLEKLSNEEIESISMNNTNSKIFWILNSGVVILSIIYLVISIVNKGLLINFFGETLNKVIINTVKWLTPIIVTIIIAVVGWLFFPK